MQGPNYAADAKSLYDVRLSLAMAAALLSVLSPP
jgi:hypothetical protein